MTRPTCPDCGHPLSPTEPGCQHVERRLRAMAVHEPVKLARRLAYIEAWMALRDAEPPRPYPKARKIRKRRTGDPGASGAA